MCDGTGPKVPKKQMGKKCGMKQPQTQQQKNSMKQAKKDRARQMLKGIAAGRSGSQEVM